MKLRSKKPKLAVAGRGEDAQRLAEALGCHRNVDAEIVIRYGNRHQCRGDFEINPVPALERARHKYQSLEIFDQKGLPVPYFGIDRESMEPYYTLLGRKFTHQGGTDIKVLRSPRDYHGESQYFVQFLPVDTEYRCHIVCGEVISLAEKCDGEKKDCYCRNLKHGWIFKERKPERVHSDVIPLSKKAVKALGLHFGAVDVIISKGEAYLLEVNTAPGIIERRAILYANAINEYLGSL